MITKFNEWFLTIVLKKTAIKGITGSGGNLNMDCMLDNSIECKFPHMTTVLWLYKTIFLGNKCQIPYSQIKHANCSWLKWYSKICVYIAWQKGGKMLTINKCE